MINFKFLLLSALITLSCSKQRGPTVNYEHHKQVQTDLKSTLNSKEEEIQKLRAQLNSGEMEKEILAKAKKGYEIELEKNKSEQNKYSEKLKTEIESLKESDDALKSFFEEYPEFKNFTDIEKAILTLKASLKESRDQVSQLNTELTKYKKMELTLKEKLKQKDEKNLELSKSLEQEKDIFKKNKSELASSLIKIQELQARIDQITEQGSEQDETLENLQEEKKELEKSFNHLIAKLNTNQSNLDKLKNQLSLSKGEKELLQKKIIQIQERMGDKGKAILELEVKLSQKEEEIANNRNIQEKLNSELEKNEDLNSKFEEFKTKYAELSSERDELLNRIGVLNQKILVKENENNDLRSSVSRKNLEIQSLNENNKVLDAQNKALQSQLEDLRRVTDKLSPLGLKVELKPDKGNCDSDWKIHIKLWEELNGLNDILEDREKEQLVETSFCPSKEINLDHSSFSISRPAVDEKSKLLCGKNRPVNIVVWKEINQKDEELSEEEKKFSRSRTICVPPNVIIPIHERAEIQELTFLDFCEDNYQKDFPEEVLKNIKWSVNLIRNTIGKDFNCEEIGSKINSKGILQLEMPDFHKNHFYPMVIQGLNIKNLKLENLSIESLKWVKNHTELRNLNLSTNHLSNLEGIEVLENLKELNLSYQAPKEYLLRNRFLKDISLLSNLKNLQILKLRSNKIEDLSPLSGLKKIRTLNISYNNVKDLSPLGDITRLRHLNLGYNPIDSLGPLSSKKLTFLDVSSIKARDFSPLGNFRNLEILHVSKNKGIDLAFLRYLKRVTQFHADNIQGGPVEVDFSPLTHLNKLKFLSVKSNELKSIPESFASVFLPNLDVSYNPLNDFRFPKVYKNLASLTLNGCSMGDKDFKALTQNMESSTAMKKLEFSFNQVSNLTPLKNLKLLRVLIFQENQISNLSGLSQMEYLNKLDFKGNKVKSLAPIKNLKKIHYFYADENPILKNSKSCPNSIYVNEPIRDFCGQHLETAL